MLEMLDNLEFMQTIWFFVWVLLWAIYLILDGFDFGLGTLLPFLSKSDEDTRVIYNAAGPYWDGNEVWLITAGGVTFAAFPKAYAVMFSALYAPLLMLLFCLILRAVAFEFRSKFESGFVKKIWDTIMFVCNFFPALLLGVFFSNLFMGIPIDIEGVYHGNLLKLLTPFALIGGVLFVLLFALQGGIWLVIKSSGELKQRAKGCVKKLLFAVIGVLGVYLVYSFFVTPIWTSGMHNPFVFVFLVLCVLCFLLVFKLLQQENYLKTWLATNACTLFIVFFAMTGMFPYLLMSSMDTAASLTAFNASSSLLTLKIMLIVCLCTVPVVIGYQIWAYYVFRGEVTKEDLNSEHSY